MVNVSDGDPSSGASQRERRNTPSFAYTSTPASLRAPRHRTISRPYGARLSNGVPGMSPDVPSSVIRTVADRRYWDALSTVTLPPSIGRVLLRMAPLGV